MINQFGIHLKVKDIKKSLDFYTKFGLKPIFAYGDNKFLSQFNNKIPSAKEKYRGVTFSINNALFEIADGHLAVKPKTFKETIQSSKISTMLYVDSVDKIIKLCRRNSFPIASPLKKYPWGTKEIVIKDPDGFVLVFIEKINKAA